MNEAIEREMKPKTFEELKAMGKTPQQCRRCGQKRATHTLSMTAAAIGQSRGSTVSQIQRAPVCEPCGVEVFGVVKKALKA
jgi:hypothetical protein